MIPDDQPPGTAPRPRKSVWRRSFGVISSPRLAIALLVAILVFCILGVTVVKGARAGELIFSTLWFNGLLVLLALSSGLTFFARIWGRKLTLVSAGMIIFHVSFMALLGGVVFNSLFHFTGVLRLTEGETLPNGDPASYDSADAGRFFKYDRLRGETTLMRMHVGYKVDGLDKRAAYEIAVGEGAEKSTAIIYMTQNLDHDGVRYLVSKEGYSLGVVLHERQGRELKAVMVPLQSLPRGKNSFTYTTGSATEAGAFPFPPPPDQPLRMLQLRYLPDPRKERAGRVEYAMWPVTDAGPHVEPTTGSVVVGGHFPAGDHEIELAEVRYWVGMTVRRDPGLTVILTSLWAGLAGMTMTFVGRILQDAKREKRQVSNPPSVPTATKEKP